MEPPDPLWLYAIFDNGYERVGDWYDSGYYSHTPVKNPQGPPNPVHNLVQSVFFWYRGIWMLVCRLSLSLSRGTAGRMCANKRNYVMSKVKYIFTLLGMAMLLGALFCYYNTSRFLTSAIVTEGMVVGFQELRGESSSTYKPIVVFMTENEETVKFTSSVGSGRPSYSKGDDVKVLYLSSDPQGAKLDGFFDLWGA
jgi:hypothetical protein